MKKEEKSTPDLTPEKIIKDALYFIDMTLNGLGRDDEYRVEITNTYTIAKDPYIRIKVPGLNLSILLTAIEDKKFNNLLDAAKAFALCAVNFTVRYADGELFTRPDEQGFMRESMAFWHKLKDEAFIYKNKYLVTTSSDE
jgi:hypothetical protein